jgi:hypothetical protein
MHRDTRFQNNATIVDTYGPYLVDEEDEDGEEEVVAAKWNWGKKIVMVPNPWGRKNEESYDFDITKADKLFNNLNYLLIMSWYLLSS